MTSIIIMCEICKTFRILDVIEKDTSQACAEGEFWKSYDDNVEVVNDHQVAMQQTILPPMFNPPGKGSSYVWLKCVCLMR